MSVDNRTEALRIPASRQTACVSCGEIIDSAAASTFQRVSGYVQNRQGHIVLMERSLSWMCRPCVDRRKVGAHIEQGALFDERD